MVGTNVLFDDDEKLEDWCFFFRLPCFAIERAEADHLSDVGWSVHESRQEYDIILSLLLTTWKSIGRGN